MASTITAGNATNGLALSCDNTGILELKTGTGAGTTAITADASQVVTAASNMIVNGNVGIGTSSPGYAVDVRRGAGVDSYMLLAGNNGGTTSGMLIGQDTAGLSRIFQFGANPLTFWTNSSERARIDSSGNLLVGTTSSGGVGFTVGVDGAGRILTSNVSAVPFDVYLFKNGGTTVGKITINTSSTSYTTTSDHRLKEDVQPMTGALARVAALKPVTYKWKIDGSDGEGFIAHELQAVVPDAVTGEKDAVNEDGSIKPQGIDTSFLVATLTAAIQEQQQMIETLQAEVAALKGA